MIGINTAIVSRTGGYQGIGFAIPSQMAMQVKDAILKHGKVVRGWLGVAIQNVSEELADAASRAASLGLRPGDVIVEVNRLETPTIEAFRKAAKTRDRHALVLVYRDGVTLYMSLAR